ncbi:hypothetical protein JXJ21_16905, partial [candidate division KSB1 bacterium]|nr:hypothetical protein [candidate division KSB1 bacterium]
MNNFNIICAILSLASIIGTLVRGILKSTANIIITSILIFYLIHTLTLGDEYSPIVPTFFLLLYVVFLNIKPKFFDISKNKNGNEMLEEFFKNIQAQGAQSSKTLQIIAETYKKGYSSVCIGCN